MIAFMFILLTWRNPYGADFARLTVPAILILASAQSLLLLLRWHGQLALSLIFLAVGGLVFQTAHSAVTFREYSALTMTFMAIYTILICWMVADPRSRKLSVAQSLLVTFILLLGQYLQYQNIIPKSTESGRLFALPILITALWTVGSLSGWSGSLRFTLVISLLQIAIGFWDLGMREHIRIMVACAGGATLLGLILSVYWPQKLFPLKAVDAIKSDTVDAIKSDTA